MTAAGEPTVIDGFSPARAKAGKVGSLGVFWALVEPILTRLRPRRLCEIGVDSGAFTERLLDWGRAHGCGYTGIDPVVDPALAARLDTQDLFVGHSLDILPRLDRCGVYFVDGDHNYHTVLHELELIQHAAVNPSPNSDPAGPVVFVHDVGWPWGRRDMYYEPSTVPMESRRPSSDCLGVGLDGDDLLDGGLRDPASYHIALEAGGPRNGVLTAVEDFLTGEAGRAWEAIIVPAAYGLAILYRPDDGGLPADCRQHLRALRGAIDQTRGFLAACEANYLTLYFYGEHTKYELDRQTHRLQSESGAHHRTLEAYRTLDEVYRTTVKHGNGVTEVYRGLQTQYSSLQGGYTALQGTYAGLLGEYAALQSTHAGLQGGYEALQGAYAGLQGEYAALQGTYTGLQREYMALQGAYAGLRGEYMALQSACSDQQGEYVALQGGYASLLTEYNRLLDHNAGLQKICDDFIAISRDLVSAAEESVAPVPGA